jgi:hypothetical protein
MNKRGQMYILAAIILSIAIFSVMKVSNKAVGPAQDNFDFFVDNYEGERSYVMNLGYLEGKEGNHYLRNPNGQDGLLETFQDFGINVGVVHVEYGVTEGWAVTNYLGEDKVVNVGDDCEGCEEFIVPSAATGAAEVSFSFKHGSKKWKPGKGSDLSDVEFGPSYFTKKIDGGENIITIEIDDNEYSFQRPASGKDKVESIVFRNIGEDYVKIVKV